MKENDEFFVVFIFTIKISNYIYPMLNEAIDFKNEEEYDAN